MALHDVLHTFDGPIRVFAEAILPSDDFGPAGVCGSIGWAQYRPRDGTRWRDARHALARRAQRLVPLVTKGRELRGLDKVQYKILRALIPHAAVRPEDWIALVDLRESSRVSP